MYIAGAEGGCKFEVPVLPDMYGMTALDICMGEFKFRKGNPQFRFFKHDEESMERLVKATENLNMANCIFKNLTSYGFMHSSYQITEAIITATRRSLPSIGEYLDSRLKEVDHCFETKTQRGI